MSKHDVVETDGHMPVFWTAWQRSAKSQSSLCKQPSMGFLLVSRLTRRNRGFLNSFIPQPTSEPNTFYTRTMRGKKPPHYKICHFKYVPVLFLLRPFSLG